MNNEIEHTGEVRSIGENNITVILDDTGSCGCCPAAIICGTKEKVTDSIVIQTDFPGVFSPGEKIRVIMSTGSQHQAIITGIVFPCLILLLTVTGIYILSGNDLYAALSGLIMTASYYFILYLNRDKIQKRMIFKAEKTDV